MKFKFLSKEIPKELESLCKEIKKYNPKYNSDIIVKAYKLSKEAHKTQKRQSGELYITHPLKVAYILAKLKLDEDTIVAALLHDVVEDSSYTLEDIKREFSEDIAYLVDSVTKLTKLRSKSREEYNAQSIRKMLLASTKDLRVIFIKLADKLHNMRTIKYLSENSQKRIAKDVLEIYAPIAYKLGIWTIKWQLENLAFKVLIPEKYKELEEKVKRKRKEREKEIEEIEEILLKEFKRNKLDIVEIQGRPKHLYGIYQKMIKKNRSFEQVYDLVGLRVITKAEKDCYTVLGIIHNLWKPVPGKFKDYIGTPKPNMYQSLHTVVFGPKKNYVEFQIKTKEMHELAEEGVAAHWIYKEITEGKIFDKRLSWLRQILEWQKDAKKTKDFMESLKIDFFGDEVYTFTPKGDVIELPRGSCVIDFAYAVHTRIGDNCTGARINGKFVPLKHEVKTGDVVEIVTAKNHKPSRDWLKIVKTPRAKTKIKQTIRQNQDIPIKSLAYKSPLKSYAERQIVNIDGVNDPIISFARCCNPLPGDEINAFVTRTDKVIIHKTNCLNTDKLKTTKRKKIVVSWKEDIDSLVEIEVLSLDRPGLFADLINTISSTGTVIKKANTKSFGMDSECSFDIKAESLNHLRDIIKRINNIKNVRRIRIEQKKNE